jgi:predicted AAA+ superfamily ATPase
MEFVTNALYGENLRNMVAVAKKYDKRDCYDVVHQYLYGEQIDKVCLLYGLRRTGKTTLIRQLILNMSEEEFSKTIYIKATQTDTISDINKDLKTANREGFKYIFVDEVTLIEDFIDSASIFSDVYAAIGMKIVLSGTDSLGFYFAINEQLYDRAVMIHTTFIPFREHARLLNIKDVDEYIRYGGTLKAGELRFENEEVNAVEASFRDDESTRRYIDTAICKNIQNSLKCYEEGGHFRHLKKLYEAGELTNAINRIIQDMNHEFTVDIILKEFKSRDLKSASQMLRSAKKEEQRTDALDEINTEDILNRLKKILEIHEKEELKQEISDAIVTEIKEYLKALDLIEFTEVETTAQLANSIEHVIFTQPGMRYCQAEALVYSLMKSNEFKLLSEREKMLISAKILNDVRGIMLEDIVLLETKKTCKKTEKVFKLQFDAGEFDMVIYNSISNTCEVYEIKHSSRQIQQQFKNLIKDEYISQTEKKYGKITKKCVLYKGETSIVDNGIEYKNVEEYLMER